MRTNIFDVKLLIQTTGTYKKIFFGSCNVFVNFSLKQFSSLGLQQPNDHFSKEIIQTWNVCLVLLSLQNFVALRFVLRKFLDRDITQCSVSEEESRCFCTSAAELKYLLSLIFLSQSRLCIRFLHHHQTQPTMSYWCCSQGLCLVIE